MDLFEKPYLKEENNKADEQMMKTDFHYALEYCHNHDIAKKELKLDDIVVYMHPMYFENNFAVTKIEDDKVELVELESRERVEANREDVFFVNKKGYHAYMNARLAKGDRPSS